MRRWIFNKWVQLVLRVAIGCIFIYAGVLKIQAPVAFADSIASFQLLPDSLINLLALSLPVFEILVGALLIMGFLLRSAAFAVSILTLVFAIALVSALGRGLTVDCGCFGGGTPSAIKTGFSLARDTGLFLAAIAIYWKAHERIP